MYLFLSLIVEIMATATGFGSAGIFRLYFGMQIFLLNTALSPAVQSGSLLQQTQALIDQTTLYPGSVSHIFEDSKSVLLNSTTQYKGIMNGSSSKIYTTFPNSSTTRIMPTPLDTTPVESTTAGYKRIVSDSSRAIYSSLPVLSTRILTKPLDTTTVEAISVISTKTVNSSSTSILPISPTIALLTTSLDTQSVEISTVHTSSKVPTPSSSTTLVGHAHILSSGIANVSSSKHIGNSSDTGAYSISPSVPTLNQTLLKTVSNISSLYPSELQTKTASWLDMYSVIPSAFSLLSTHLKTDVTTNSYSLYIPPLVSFSDQTIQNTSVYTSQLISPTKSISVMYTSVSLPSNTQSISLTTQVNSGSPSHASKISNTSSALLRPTMPKPLTPPPSSGTSSPRSTRYCSIGGGDCCAFCLNQLPGSLSFDESQSAGTVLATMNVPVLVNISFDVEVTLPAELQPILKDHFNITSHVNQFILMLDREIDLEYLYTKSKRTYDVNKLLISVRCHEALPNSSTLVVPPKLINVTINDVDDCMPEFQQGTDDTDCVIPIYTADTSEDYLGILDVSPAPIKAIDGDVSQRHNVTYRILHSEPNDYDVYFSLDENEGTVNKTKPMNVSKQSKYVLFVQAMEDSPQQMARVAILSVEVFAPAEPIGGASTAGNEGAKMGLQILFALIALAFISGLIVILHRRYQVHQARQRISLDVIRDIKLPQLAVYSSSISSLGSIDPPDPRPTVTSPSEVVVKTPKPIKKHTPKVKVIKVKKPLETSLRPSWNAPKPMFTRPKYNPYLNK